MPPQPSLKILFLTQVLPYPLFGGAKIRAYYMLRYLAKRNQVTLVSFVREDDQEDAIEHLRLFCSAVHTVPMKRSSRKNGQSLLTSLTKRQPLIIVRDHLPDMDRALLGLTEVSSFDLVHADQTSMAQYALFVRNSYAAEEKPRIVLDQHNALFLVVRRQAEYERGILKRLLWKREATLLSLYESALLVEFDEIITVTDDDRLALLTLLNMDDQITRQEHITVVPICVDPVTQPALELERSSLNIIHLGTMFWPPNIEGVLWFANEVLPIIITAVPNVNFIVAGKNPPNEVKALGTANSSISNHVEITGFVADPNPLLASSQVFVVPLLAGGGMRVKILDAWQWGLPIVSTSIGAEGIFLRAEENILIADEPHAFADAVIRLLTEPELARRLRTNGRSWVEKHYNWRKVYQTLDTIY